MYAAFATTLSVTHMPGASAPEPGASGAEWYQSTFASPALRFAFRLSGSSPPDALGEAEAEAECLGSSLCWATGFFLPSPPLVTAYTVPPMTASAATAAPTISAVLFPPAPACGTAPGAPGYGCCCG